MARIRSIKPEFPQSESIGRLSRDARLLFIQLWTVVDDAGRARAASRMLASLLYPYDDDAPKLIGRWLDELEKENLIRRYEVEGATYLEVVTWLKHQKIDKPSASRLPPFRESSANPREPSRTLAPDLGPRTLDKDQDAARAAPDPEKELFARGKEVLGNDAGGLIAKLLKAKNKNVVLARAIIDTASQKQDPREYVSAVIRGPKNGEFKLMSGMEGVI